MEKDIDGQLIGLPLNETVHKCILAREWSKADKLKSDFKIPDKRYAQPPLVLDAQVVNQHLIDYICRLFLCHCRFWWIKIKAFAEMREWDELDKLSKSKKSPIGYEVYFLRVI